MDSLIHLFKGAKTKSYTLGYGRCPNKIQMVISTTSPNIKPNLQIKFKLINGNSKKFIEFTKESWDQIITRGKYIGNCLKEENGDEDETFFINSELKVYSEEGLVYFCNPNRKSLSLDRDDFKVLLHKSHSIASDYVMKHEEIKETLERLKKFLNSLLKTNENSTDDGMRKQFDNIQNCIDNFHGSPRTQLKKFTDSFQSDDEEEEERESERYYRNKRCGYHSDDSEVKGKYDDIEDIIENEITN